MSVANTLHYPETEATDTLSVVSCMTMNGEVKTTQLFDAYAMGCIWKKAETLDPGQKSLLESLYRKRRFGNQVPITYRLSSSQAGQLGYGRLFGTKGSLEQIEKGLRGALCSKYYWDIDIVNCHPTLLVQLAKQYDIDLICLRRYVDERDRLLDSFVSLGKERDDVKSDVIKCLYGGKPADDSPDWLQGIYREMQDFSRKLIPHHYDLYEYCKVQNKNIIGSFMSYIAQTEERKCLMALYSVFKKFRSVDVLAYDGIMIRKLVDETSLDEELLRTAETKIEEITGYAVKLKVKEFEPLVFDDAMTKMTPEGVPEKDYLEMKIEWEKNRFYFMETGCIVEVNKDNTLSYMSLEMAKNNYGNRYRFVLKNPVGETTVSFINMWMKDPQRRSVRKITLSPAEDDDTYSLFNGYKFQSYTGDTPNKEKIMEYFHTVIDHITNRDSAVREYLLKWFAFMLQNPYVNPLSCIIITGQQGCGKDMIGRLIGKHVIGEYLYKDYENPNAFWDKHDTGRQGKLFIHCEETDGYMNKRNAAAFKGRITAPTMTLNPKGLNAYTSDNRCHFYMTTNDEMPIKCEQTDRRFVVIPSGNWLVGKIDFWGPCADILESDEAGKVVGDYLMNIDLASFNPRRIIESEYKKGLMEASKTVEERFIDAWNGEIKTAKELYEMYTEFCIENGEEPKKQIGFGMKLLPFVRDGVIERSESHSIIRYKKN
jgi:hypothetical protein